jgi:hypothetical protein
MERRLVDSSAQLGDGQSIHSGAIGAGIESIGNTLVISEAKANWATWLDTRKRGRAGLPDRLL